MTLVLSVFNRVAHLMHWIEEWLVSIMHVSDCVTTLETEQLLSQKTLSHIDFLYGYDSVSYKLRIPIILHKKQHSDILSVTVNGEHDITDYVKSMAGPFNNFYLQSLTVQDIVPVQYHGTFENLEVIDGKMHVHHHTTLDQRIHFQYSIDWPKYDDIERNHVLQRLNHLDLA